MSKYEDLTKGTIAEKQEPNPITTDNTGNVLDDVYKQYEKFKKDKPKNHSFYFIAIPEGCKIVDMLPEALLPEDKVCIMSHPENIDRLYFQPVELKFNDRPWETGGLKKKKDLVGE